MEMEQQIGNFETWNDVRSRKKRLWVSGSSTTNPEEQEGIVNS